MRQPPLSIFALPQLGVTGIGLEGVATRCAIIQYSIKAGPREIAESEGRGDFRKKLIRLKRRRTGASHDMLGQTIQFHDHGILGVLGILLGRLQCGLAFEHLKTVGRHQQRVA